jgi:uncharacterized protein
MARKTNKNEEEHKMTRQEAGHLGGQATARTHNTEFYEEIGRQGGKVSPGNFKNDPERAREAGRKGGLARGSDSETTTMDDAA